MAESTLGYTWTTLKQRIAFDRGWGMTLGSLTAEQVTQVEAIVQEGTSQFVVPPVLPGQANAHEWSFLRIIQEIQTNEKYDTGTVTTNGTTTITLATGTWPSWAASGKIRVSDGPPLDVATRSSDSVVLLASAYTGTSASGLTYELIQDDYPLADDFQRLDGPITYLDGESWCPITVVPESAIRIKRQVGTRTGPPMLAAVRIRQLPGASGLRHELMLYPEPDDAYNLSFRYFSIPNLMSDSLTYPPGGALHSQTLLASCLAIAASMFREEYAAERQLEFMRRLTASISLDARSHRPGVIGYNRDTSDYQYEDGQAATPVTYHGEYGSS